MVALSRQRGIQNALASAIVLHTTQTDVHFQAPQQMLDQMRAADAIATGQTVTVLHK
ncbi:MAG: hypothetical protein ABR992_20565 [Solirubrobacteraceae bacterium]|jgi:hypothetical protein